MKTTHIIIRVSAIFLIIGIALKSKSQQDSLHAIDSTSAFQVEKSPNTETESTLRHDTYIAFDSKNNSYSFDFSSKSNYGSLFINENGNIRKVNLLTSIQKLYPKTVVPKDTLLHALGSITIDRKDRIYLIYYFYYPFDSGLHKWKARIPLLLFSNDEAKSFKAYTFPGNPDMAFLEKKSPFERDNYPPLIGYTKSTRIHVSPMADQNDFGFFVPQISDPGELIFKKQVLLTHFSPGISNHTGGESFASTFGRTTSIAYNEIPKEKNGNDIIVVDYDRQNNKIINRETIPLIIKSKYPYPDPHVTPVIVTCSNGDQHVLVSPQAGDCYDYTRNVANSHTDNFIRSAVLKGPRVYASAFTDSDDNIYLFYDAYKPKPGLYSQKYTQQTHTWGVETRLASPPKDFTTKTKDNFGIYYFKAAIDLQNKVYVSFTFLDTYEKAIFPRYLFKSSDKGFKWTLDR